MATILLNSVILVALILQSQFNVMDRVTAIRLSFRVLCGVNALLSTVFPILAMAHRGSEAIGYSVLAHPNFGVVGTFVMGLAMYMYADEGQAERDHESGAPDHQTGSQM